MRHQTFLSADKKTKSHLICWMPEVKPIATIQIIHGMAEYIARYDEFAKYLTTLGYVVIGHDHLGHGESITANQRHGYFGQGDSVCLVLEDIHQVCQWIEERYSELPHFILGHSMGSFALRNYLQSYQPDISGAILMGTGKQATLMPFALSLTAKLNKMKPKRKNKWVDHFAFGSFNKLFPEPSSFNWLSKNQENVTQYENDPLTGFTFTNNGFYTLFRLVNQANQVGWADNIQKKLPLLIISGEQDPVGDFGKGPRRVAKQLAESGVKDVSLVLFSTLRHEILLETEKNEVYQAISQWIEKKRGSLRDR